MTARSFFYAFLVIIILALPVAATQKNNVELCHIANAGFYVQSETTGVYIDAIMQRDDYDGTWALPSPETLANMRTGTGLFSNARLALVSHNHGDHFDAAAVLALLRGDEDVMFVMPKQAYVQIKSLGMAAEETSRIHIAQPKENGPDRLRVAGVEIEGYAISHGQHDIENIGYRFKLGDLWFFATGGINTSVEELEKAGLKKTHVDIMVTSFFIYYSRLRRYQNHGILVQWSPLIIRSNTGPGWPLSEHSRNCLSRLGNYGQEQNS